LSVNQKGQLGLYEALALHKCKITDEDRKKVKIGSHDVAFKVHVEGAVVIQPPREQLYVAGPDYLRILDVLFKRNPKLALDQV
jgi:hypothetical protein